MEPTDPASDPTHCANGSEYFTHEEVMIAFGSIHSGPAVSGSDPKSVGPFTDSFITYRKMVCDKIVAIFQGSDACTSMKPSKKYSDVRMIYKLIYIHKLVPSNI